MLLDRNGDSIVRQPLITTAAFYRRVNMLQKAIYSITEIGISFIMAMMFNGSFPSAKKFSGIRASVTTDKKEFAL